MDTASNHPRYKVGTAGKQIMECSTVICKNLSSFDADPSSAKLQRGFLSQNILQQLRNLIEALAVSIANNNDLSIKFHYSKTGTALKKCKGIAKYKFIADFHNLLQKSASHYTFDEDSSERLMIKYYEYLLQVRKLCVKTWNIAILENLEKFPLNLDNGLQEYYEKIAAKIQNQFIFSNTGHKDRYYIDRVRPFFVDSEVYYEVTFHNALNSSSKATRLIGFTNIDISDYYAAKLKIERTEIEIFTHRTSVNIITEWEVSIRQCEFNNFLKIFDHGQKGININNIEYKRLMKFLTISRMSLVDLMDITQEDFNQYIIYIEKNAGNNIITRTLKKIRNMFSDDDSRGINVLRYLMLRMNNNIIKSQLSNEKNPLLSDLFLSWSCIPFDDMPLCTSLKNHNPRLSDVLRCISPHNREHELLNRLVKNNTEQRKMLYTPLYELEKWLVRYKDLLLNNNMQNQNVEDLIRKFNSLVYYKHDGRKMHIDKGHVFIKEYDEGVKSIIEKLDFYVFSKDHNFKEKVNQFINGGNINIDDPVKKDALTHLFEKSSVAFIYGAAGTGKTTMIDLVARLYVGKSKLFLAHTHPAVENLKRRVVYDENSTFSTIEKWIKSGIDKSYDLLVIDECSTVSNKSFLEILEKVKVDKILLVGDLYQIESIQFGNWFDIAGSFIPGASIFELTHPYRTEEDELKILWDRVRKFDISITESLVGAYSRRLDASFFDMGNNFRQGNDHNDEIVLCLNYDGLYGINNVNQMLQERNSNPAIEWNSGIFKKGDPVIFTNTERFEPIIFNNLKGEIVDIKLFDEKAWFDVSINRKPEELARECTQYPDIAKYIGDSIVRITIYRYMSNDNDTNDPLYIVPFQVAYAVSIHKSQGLEYNSVKILITADAEEHISHNIFYTAITRSKKRLAIYWSPESENKITTSFKRKEDHNAVNLLCARFPQLDSIRKRIR